MEVVGFFNQRRVSVGDITTKCKPPRRGRFTLNYMKPVKTHKMAMKLRGPDPKGRLGPIVVNRYDYITCVVS